MLIGLAKAEGKHFLHLRIDAENRKYSNRRGNRVPVKGEQS